MVMTDNLDLFIRRKRVGKRQRDVRDALLEATGTRVSISAISDFENGERDDLHTTDGIGRKHYEAVLARWEQGA